MIIVSNGESVARLISNKSSVGFLTDTLKGVLKKDYDDKLIAAERFES